MTRVRVVYVQTRRMDQIEREIEELEQQILEVESLIKSLQIPQRRREKRSYNDPELISHCPLDPSIAHFFPTNGASTMMDTFKSSALTRAATQTFSKELLMYENIFRLGGITAFPLDKVHGHTLLGIRFEEYSVNAFLKPHYLILIEKVIIDKDADSVDITVPDHDTYKEKIESVSRWGVYRHTLPQYVPLTELASVLDTVHGFQAVLQLSRAVRKPLVHRRYKLDEFQKLAQFTREKFIDGSDPTPLLVCVEPDLQGISFRIEIANHFDANHQLFIECRDLRIETISVQLALSITQFCTATLQGIHIKHLIGSFNKLLLYMAEQKCI